MTLSRTERSENFSVALKTMLDTIGDAAVDEFPFAPAAHPGIFTTTWDELLSSELIEVLSSGEYILTGRGWTAAVISTGKINERGLQQRIGILFARSQETGQRTRGAGNAIVSQPADADRACRRASYSTRSKAGTWKKSPNGQAAAKSASSCSLVKVSNGVCVAADASSGVENATISTTEKYPARMAKMAGIGSKLTPKQEEAILALLTNQGCGQHRSRCLELGLGRCTDG